jgi:hypothetical protein
MNGIIMSFFQYFFPFKIVQVHFNYFLIVGKALRDRWFRCQQSNPVISRVL